MAASPNADKRSNVFPNFRARSLAKNMIVARTAEALSPLIIQKRIMNIPDKSAANEKRIRFLNNEKRLMPMKEICSPEIASMCAIPLFLYNSFVSASRELLSPVRIARNIPAWYSASRGVSVSEVKDITDSFSRALIHERTVRRGCILSLVRMRSPVRRNFSSTPRE